MNGYNQYGQPSPQYPQTNGFMGGGQQYPGHGYGQPPSAMGFHSQGGHMGGNQGYQRREGGEHEKVLAFFRSVAYGEQPCPEELKQVILGVVGEQANGMLAQYGYSQTGEQGGQHHRYKEVLEELRDIPNVTEAVKRAAQHFEGLTDEDRKVLQQLLNRPSYKKSAQMAGLPLERFMAAKKELEYKLKQ